MKQLTSILSLSFTSIPRSTSPKFFLALSTFLPAFTTSSASFLHRPAWRVRASLTSEVKKSFTEERVRSLVVTRWRKEEAKVEGGGEEVVTLTEEGSEGGEEGGGERRGDAAPAAERGSLERARETRGEPEVVPPVAPPETSCSLENVLKSNAGEGDSGGSGPSGPSPVVVLFGSGTRSAT